ncbi:MAG: hypothetical protein ACXU93_05400, partial [Thermodesulfobacteriota bacterium]
MPVRQAGVPYADLREKKFIFQVSVEYVILNVADLKEFTFRTVPLDPDREPVFLGNGDPIFF